jgi:hypothetical protein
MRLNQRIIAALAAIAFVLFTPVYGAATLDHAVCSIIDKAGGNPAICEGQEIIDSATQEVAKAQEMGNYALTGVSGINDIVACSTPTIVAVNQGMGGSLKPAATNTGPVRLNWCGTGLVSVVSSYGNALVASDLVSTGLYKFEYYQPANQYRITSGLGIGAAPASAAFFTLGSSASLSGERSLVFGSGLSVTDLGPNSTLTLSASSSTVNVQIITSSGTWTKPSTGSLAFIKGWGGGGAGCRGQGAQNGNGGSGGAYFERWIPLSLLGATETVTVGLGGTIAAANVTAGSGGNSTFGTWLTARGGLGGAPSGSVGTIGTAFSTLFPGTPVTLNAALPHPWNGGFGGAEATVQNAGGHAINGGAGGGGGNNGASYLGGTSLLGGNGGAGSFGGTAVTGSIPGGGGGGARDATAAGAGGRGQIEIYVF